MTLQKSVEFGARSFCQNFSSADFYSMKQQEESYQPGLLRARAGVGKDLKNVVEIIPNWWLRRTAVPGRTHPPCPPESKFRCRLESSTGNVGRSPGAFIG